LTADQAVHRYLRLREGLSAPRSQDAAAVRGYLLAARCACGGVEHHEVRNERARAWIVRCRRCGRPWRREIAFVPRAAIQGGRTVREPAALADLATLARALEALGPWERRVLEYYVAWPGPGRADSGIAELGRERWPEAPFPWTQHQVRKQLRSARAALDAELHRRGLE
jgi:hypothetical protein